MINNIIIVFSNIIILVENSVLLNSLQIKNKLKLLKFVHYLSNEISNV